VVLRLTLRKPNDGDDNHCFGPPAKRFALHDFLIVA
jgi:hypothetical protein